MKSILSEIVFSIYGNHTIIPEILWHEKTQRRLMGEEEEAVDKPLILSERLWLDAITHVVSTKQIMS